MGDFADVGVEGALPADLRRLQHVLRPARARRTRCGASRTSPPHLADDGVFVDRGLRPRPRRGSTAASASQTIRGRHGRGDAGRIEARPGRAADRAASHVVITEAGTKLYPVNLRYAFPSELDLMARLAGLELQERWGGWNARAVHGRAASATSRCTADERAGPRRLRPGRAGHPRPRGHARQARRADRRGEGARRQPRRLPGDLRPGLPELGLGEVPRRLGRPAREGRVRACSRASRSRCPAPTADRLGEIARDNEVWLVTGVNERDPRTPGTLYNALLYHSPEGELAVHHRKLVPTNHERLIWGQGDGGGLRAVQTPIGRIGGLICWENYMPLARFSLYESGVEIYIASTADDGDAWQATLVHIARESRAFVVAPSHFQRAGSYPDDFPLKDELAVAGRPRPRRLGDPRAGRLVPRRAALRRGGDPLRRPRAAAPGRGAAALRPGRPLPPARRARAEGDAPPRRPVAAYQRSQWTNVSSGARTAGLNSVPTV